MERNTRFLIRPNKRIIRGMGLLIICKKISEAEQILEAIITIILSKFDGPILLTMTNNDAIVSIYSGKIYNEF